MAPLKWFSPESSDIPQFMLDELEEGTEWEKIEGETHRASAQLVLVRGPFSSELEEALGALEALGKGVDPCRVHSR
jgi:hypothetical protein